MPEPDANLPPDSDSAASTAAAAPDKRVDPVEPAADAAPTPADVGAPAPTPDAAEEKRGEKFFSIFRGLGSAGIVGLLTIFLPPIGLALMAAFMDEIQPVIESLGAWGPVAFALTMVVMAGLSIMPTQVYSIFAGLLVGQTFGFLIGSAAAVGGAVGAAMLMYGWVTVIAKDKVMRQVETHRKARIIHHALVDRGFWESLGLVTLLRFPPNMPFAFSGFVMAAMKVNFIAYALGTLLGMTPRLAICVWIGMTIGSFEEARKNPYSFWFMVVSIVVAIIIVVLLSHVVKKALAKYDPEANGAAPANKIA